MAHIFLEIKGIKPGVETPADLSYVIRDDNETTFSISSTVVEWIKGTIDFAAGAPLPKLKNCCFAFANGTEFVEFDAKGKLKPATSVTPEWYPDLGKFLREQWLVNNEMYDLSIVDFIKVFLDTFNDVNERRTHCDLLFDLQLDKSAATAPDQKPAAKIGNKNRLSTQPKVRDLNSFEIFNPFFLRLEKAIHNDQFPTMRILTGHEDLAKAPAALKGAVRTWFKAITGSLPPNNKRVDAGNPEIFCAPIRAMLAEIKEYGVERYYQALSQAIQQADGLSLDKFEYSLPKK
ncbi:hypothetical protein [Atlantibacter sp.]|uniref:hypothetical protein n=1 Tax=Atlantibacter sp. TaxID=1903473 RepID=UPI0028B1E022|nr:hypothetical protein [Atlantibacter sp.]